MYQLYKGYNMKNGQLLMMGNSSTEGLGYGYLYNWYAVTDANFPESSMRVPSTADYLALYNEVYVTSALQVTYDLCTIEDIKWNGSSSIKANATNSSGLTAFGAGIRGSSFQYLNNESWLWTTAS